MSAQVVVVGSYNQDHVWRTDRFPQAGETRRGHGFATGPGGKGFNQAVACVRQGVPTLFVGARGDDASGTAAVRTAAEAGLDCRWQVHPDRPTGSACIVVDADGQNRIVVDLAANEHLDAAFLQSHADAFAEAGVLLAQMENAIEATRGALQLAGDHGLLRVLNPAPVHAQLTADTMQLADVLVPNEGEFADLCRRFLDSHVDAAGLPGMDDASLHALAQRLGVGSVVVTLGRHGCFVSHGDDRRGDTDGCYRIAAEAVAAVDTTGAGDAFCGALAAGLVRFAAQPFAAAVRHANRVAAMATERRGAAAAMPRFDEVRTRFAS